MSRWGLGLVLLTLVLSACSIEIPQEEKKEKKKRIQPPAVILKVEGRPDELRNLIIKAKLTSDKPVRVPMCQGKPIALLKIKIGKKLWHLTDEAFPVETPGITHIPDLVEKHKEVTKLEWEFRGEEMQGSDLSALEANFQSELRLIVPVPLATGNKTKKYEFVRGEISLPKY